MLSWMMVHETQGGYGEVAYLTMVVGSLNRLRERPKNIGGRLEMLRFWSDIFL